MSGHSAEKDAGPIDLIEVVGDARYSDEFVGGYVRRNLAAHDAKTIGDALRQIADWVEQDYTYGSSWGGGQIAQRLRERAKRIEASATPPVDGREVTP